MQVTMMEDESQTLLHATILGEATEHAEGAAVFVWNEERRYVAVNQEACRLTGLTRAELIGMPVGALSPDGAVGDIERTRSVHLVRGASSFTRRDGTLVDIAWVTTHSRVAGLPYMISFCWPAGRNDA
jgi:PAS domain S-box-containing protein